MENDDNWKPHKYRGKLKIIELEKHNIQQKPPEAAEKLAFWRVNWKSIRVRMSVTRKWERWNDFQFRMPLPMDCTSALDTENERKLYESLQERKSTYRIRNFT